MRNGIYNSAEARKNATEFLREMVEMRGKDLVFMLSLTEYSIETTKKLGKKGVLHGVQIE